MTTAYSTNLELALPVQGELSGTWGDTVNNGITQYLDTAIAGSQIISGSQTAVTLTNTNGDASATNIAQVGSGASGTAQYQIIRCTGNPASLLTITVSDTGTVGYSKTFVIINATSTSQSVKIVGSGPTTGVTVPSGAKALVAWNGSDFVEVASSTADGVTTFSAGTTGFTPSTATSGAVTLAGTLATTNGGTGQTSYTDGQLLIGNSTGNTLSKATLTAGSNITITNGAGAITIASSNSGGTVTSVGGTGTVNGLSLSGTVTSSGNLTLGGTLSNVANSALTNSSVTVTAGTGMSGGGTVALGSSVTLTNAGVTSLVAGTGITVSGATGAVTVSASSTGGKAANVQTFNSSGTWTKPSGYGSTARVQIQVWGGGGGGANAIGGNNGGGGGGGAYNERWLPLSSLGATETATVGAGGTLGTSAPGGGTGGTTSLGTLVYAYGGGGGSGSNCNAAQSGGGGGGQLSAGTMGSVSVSGTPYSGRPWINTVPKDSSGSAQGLSAISEYPGSVQGQRATESKFYDAFWHGGGGGSRHNTNTGAGLGGVSVFGGGGGGAGAQVGGTSQNAGSGGNSPGGAAGAPAGGGAGGTPASTTGSAGAAGRIIVTVFDGT